MQRGVALVVETEAQALVDGFVDKFLTCRRHVNKILQVPKAQAFFKAEINIVSSLHKCMSQRGICLTGLVCVCEKT